MLNSRERSNLLSLANSIDTTVYIGKNGLTEAVISQIDQMLTDHELIKIGVQKNADFTARECINVLCDKLSAEPVHAIGSKLIVYRRSDKEGITHVDYSKSAKEARESAKVESAKPTKAKPVADKKPIGRTFDKKPFGKGKSDKKPFGKDSRTNNFDKKTESKKSKSKYAPEKKDGITIYKNGKKYGKK